MPRKSCAMSILLLTITAAACKTTGVRSSAKLNGGQADDVNFPATVAIAAVNATNDLILYCTGTFVRDDLVVTAGHCTQAPGISKFILFGKAPNWKSKRPESSLYTVHPDFSMDEPSPRPTDMAFLHFPSGTATPDMIAKLSADEAWSDHPVSLVGYGGSVPNWQWDLLGVRRVGRTNISGLWYGGPYRMIKINTSEPVNPSENASINEGDSGGPMYSDKGELVGISQSGKYFEEQNYWDCRFVDLLVPSIARYWNAEFAGQTPIIDATKPKAAFALTGDQNSLSRCIENNGLGHGPMSSCGTRKCAKKSADLKQDCYVYPTWSGRNYCTKNAGRGFGKIFDCNGLRCAKNNKEETQECVLLAFIDND